MAEITTTSGTARYFWPYAKRPRVTCALGAFGAARSGGEIHIGTDFGDADRAPNPPILACTDGIVSRAGWNNSNDRTAGYGLFVVIDHYGDPYSSLYGHLKSLTVKVGDSVIGGQQIGFQGSTGNSTGNHLHFQVQKFKGTKKITVKNTTLGKLSGLVIDPIYFLTGGLERSPNTDSAPGVHVTPSEAASESGGSASGYLTDLDINIGGSKLLEPSADERKYGVSVYDTVQSLIRGTTASGVSSSENVFKALEKYAKYIYNYINAGVSTATIQTVSLPQFRPGFNCWVDPINIDSVYYVNNVSHQGSKQGGVYTTLGLTFCRDRSKFQEGKYAFGSLKPGSSDNVFINSISVAPDKFSKNLLSAAADFNNLKTKMANFYQDGNGDLQKALNNPYYQYLYNTINTEAGTVSGSSVSPAIGSATPIIVNDVTTSTETITTAAPKTSSTIVVGSSVTMSGHAYKNQTGDSPSKTIYAGKSGKITQIGNLSNPYPYHFSTIGWVSKAQISLVANATGIISTNITKTTSVATTAEYSSVGEIQKLLNDKYANPPQVVKDRIAKHVQILKNADAYIETHYIKED